MQGRKASTSRPEREAPHRIPCRAARVVVGLLTLSLGCLTAAGADPLISLRDAAEFRAAIEDGNLLGLTTTSQQTFLTTQTKAFPGQDTSLRNTALYTNTSQVNGLVSATGTSADANALVNGAYIFDYKTDPDLTNFELHLRVTLPQVGTATTPGINQVVLALTDAADNTKLWRFDNTVLTTDQTFQFRVSQNAGAGGSTEFFMDPAFDLATVLYLQVGFRGIVDPNPGTPPPPDPGFPPAPVGGFTFNTRQFVAQVPEPGTLLLIAAAGGMALTLRRRPRRRRVPLRTNCPVE